MTPAEAEALGRRWIAAGGGWRDGMRAGGGHPRRTLFGSSQSGSTYGYALPLPKNKRGVQLRPPCPPLDPKAWPDLRDPATRGAALEVVRERWLDGWAHIFFVDGEWCLRVLPGGAMLEPFSHKRLRDFRAATEAEVLVLALEAAPAVPR